MTTDKRKKLIRVTTVPGSMFGLLKGQLNFVSDYFDVLGISSKEKKKSIEQELAEKAGVNFKVIEMTRKITPIKDLISLIKMYRTFKKEKPFIVHSHTPKAGTISMIAAKFAKVPHRLHTVAGLPLTESKGLKKRLLVNVDRLTYLFATKVYPNSYGLKDIMLDEKLIKESKLKVIANGSSNGINTEHFSPDLYDNSFRKSFREKLGINEVDFVFIYVGRIVKDKGINELIQAFDDMSSKYKNVKLLMVGYYEEDLDPLSTKTMTTIKINKNIIETGHVKDVRPYFAISNALTFPSYREGFPNVVMQACAMKLISIVTDINGCNELIDDGVTGYIIPKKDAKALYEAMAQVFLNKKQTLDMIEKSRQNIVDKYDQKIVWKAILKEYNQL